MFSRILTRKSTKDCSGQTDKLKKALQEADAVVIGAGSVTGILCLMLF